MSIRLLILAAATGVFAAVLAVSAGPQRVAAARAAGPPQLAVTVKSDGSLHATWTLPSGTKGEEFLWDTSDRMTPVGTFTDPSNPSSCGMDSWCWPARGVPLYCYAVLYHDQTGDCVGHEDIGDTQTEIDTDPLAKGTYYVQVTSMDSCAGEEGVSCSYPEEYWSNVVAVTVNPSKSSGGSSGGNSAGNSAGNSGGNSGGSSGGKTRGTARVSFTHTVTVTHADGTKTQTKSVVLVPGDVVRSYGNPTHISVADGQLVIDRNSQLAYMGNDPAPVWTVRSGQAYYSGTSGRTIHNLLDGGFSTVMVCCNAGATVTAGSGGDVVTAVSNGSGGPLSGSVLVMVKGSAYSGTSLLAGEQVTVRGKTVGVPKRFVPTRQFWK